MKRKPMKPRFSSKRSAWISPRRFGKSSTAVIGVSDVPIATAIECFEKIFVAFKRQLAYNVFIIYLQIDSDRGRKS